MGISSTAKLVYGYDLGGDEAEWLFAEYDTDEYEFRLPWFDNSDGDGDDAADGFTEQAERRLLAEIAGFTETWAPNVEGYFARKKAAEQAVGVEFVDYCSHEYAGYVLGAQEISVNWGSTEVLDFAALAKQATEGDWDAKLAAAIKALGITPKQAAPGWLLCSMYG